MVSTLDVVWTTRPGGGGRTERRYLDFVIDGVALSSLLDVDFISPFGWLNADTEKASIDRLLRQSPPDMAHDRTSLYICPECGDLGCGAVTVSVEHGDHVTDPDPAAAKRAFDAMMEMTKIDIAAIEAARRG